MNTKKLTIMMSISLLAILMFSTSITAGYATTGSNQAATTALKVYPQGTICGDAELGRWSTAQFNGLSNYQGFYSLFIVNNLILSGGQKGTVTSTSGSLTVYSSLGGSVIFNATYTGLKGKYAISGHSMSLTKFTASSIVVSLNSIKGHKSSDHLVQVGAYTNAHIPNELLSCNTQDTFAP